MRLPQFTLRSLIIAGALAALTVWGYTRWRQSAEFIVKARIHLYTKQHLIINNWDWYDSHGIPLERRPASERAKRAILECRLQYEDDLFRMYLRAARSPWLPFWPDPPPPADPW